MKVRLSSVVVVKVSVSSWITHTFLIRSVGYYGPAGGGGFLQQLQDDLLLLLLKDLISVLEPSAAHVERILKRGPQ